MTRVARYGAALGLVVAAWLAMAAAAAVFFTPAGNSVAVLAPLTGGVSAVVAAGGMPLGQKGWFVFARSAEPDFVRRLYGAGAIMVIDAESTGGCSGAPRRAPVSSPP